MFITEKGNLMLKNKMEGNHLAQGLMESQNLSDEHSYTDEDAGHES